MLNFNELSNYLLYCHSAALIEIDLVFGYHAYKHFVLFQWDAEDPFRQLLTRCKDMCFCPM